MENLKNLEKIAKIFQPQNIITSEEIDQVLKGIMEILASYKKGTDAINEDTKAVVNSLLEQTIKYNQETISDFKSEADKAHAERMKELQGFLSEVKTTLGDMEVMMSEVKDGEDADEERVIDEVINRIKIDPTVVTMSAEEVRDKLASLKDEERLDKSAIKGLEKVLQQKDLDYAIATLQQQTSFLINKGGLKVVSHDASLTGDGTPESPLAVAGGGSGITLQTDGTPNGSQTLLNLVEGTNMTITDDGNGNITFDATGGGGTPGGSTTQLQYNNAGAFGGISGATTDGTAVIYTTGNLKGTDIKASTSAGLQILSNAGTVTSLHGAGGGANNTFYGDIKADYATASTVPYFDASKNLISSAVTPTELGYVSGVTSSIQTQLNAKGTGDVVGPGSSTDNAIARFDSTTGKLIQNSTLIMDDSGNIVGPSAGFKITGGTGTTADLTFQTTSGVGATGADMHFLVGSNGATEALTILNNGRVGVNSTAPAHMLQSSTSSALFAYYATATNAANGYAGMKMAADVDGTPKYGTFAVDNSGNLVLSNVTAGRLYLDGYAGTTFREPGASYATRMVINAGGNVGIGQTTPTAVLHLKAGTATASTAPLKFTAGTVNTTPEAGTMEFTNAEDGLTFTAVSTRRQIVLDTATQTLTNKTIQAPLIDYVIEPASDDTYEGEATNDINAGDTIAQWDLTYLDSTSGRWEFADADAVATSGGVLLALAAAAGTDGNPMNVVFRGVVRNDGWTWSGAGKPLYVSTTAGGMTETAPSGASDVIRVVGYTLSDDAIYFNPDNAWVVHT